MGLWAGWGTWGVRCGRGAAVARKRDLGRRGALEWVVGGAGGVLGLDYYGDDHGAAAVVVADPLADDAAG